VIARLELLAARGESRALLRAAIFRQLSVARSRNITDIPAILRLDLAENGSLSLALTSTTGC